MSISDENDDLLPHDLDAELGSAAWMFGSGTSRTGFAEVYETGSEVCIDMEIPQAVKNEISVEVVGHMLHASVGREDRIEAEDESMYLSEHRFETFHRVVSLPDSADLDRISARYDGDVLRVRAPRTEPQRRTIAVE